MQKLSSLGLLLAAVLVNGAPQAIQLNNNGSSVGSGSGNNSSSGNGQGSKNSTAGSGFLRVNGTRLLDDKGTAVYFTGINYWSAMNLAADESSGGNQSRFNEEMEQLKTAGVNMVRIMASSEGAPTRQPFRMYPALMPAPNQWDESIFVGLDRALVKIANSGMKAILTLSNTWNWSGGFGQYMSWVNNNEQIPYPPSWDPTLNAPYGDYTTNGTWPGYIAYATQFYNDTQAQDIFKSHILKVTNRVNTLTNVSYKDDPTIIWEVANEPQPGWPDGWMEGIARFIKDAAPKQLVTSGFEGKQGEEAWKAANGPQSIDFACAHWWVQNQGIYNMTDPSPANLQAAVDSFTEYASNVSRWAQDINKPVLIEEFGMPRDNWQNVAKGAPNTSYLYDASATISNRDVYFRHVISTSLQYFLNGSAIIGTAPWAYGGIWRPTDSRNAFNETWAGDPPHEAPGWYDVYSTDNSTLSLLAEQSKNATSAIEQAAGKGDVYAQGPHNSTGSAGANVGQTGNASRLGVRAFWRR